MRSRSVAPSWQAIQHVSVEHATAEADSVRASARSYDARFRPITPPARRLCAWPVLRAAAGVRACSSSIGPL